jgi:hypothetical protein
MGRFSPQTMKIQYARTPKTVLTDTALSDRSVRVYGVLAMSVFQGNVARVGLRRIGKLIGCSRNSAHRAIQELVNQGHISAGAVNAGERSYYVLNSMLFAQKQRAGVDEVVSYPHRRLVSVRTA